MQEVEAYIQKFPLEVQEIMHEFRELITKTNPKIVETFAYQMPAYKLNGKPLVYFAGYKNHIGFYATPTGHSAFADRLKSYKQGKGSVQFPLNEPMPYQLIQDIVDFRIENILGGIK